MVINSLKHLQPEFDNIYLITEDGYIPECLFKNKIFAIKDSEVTPFINKEKFLYRFNWCWVNMLSITQDFTKNNLYLDVQADNFFLNDINLFNEDGKPKLFKTKVNVNNNNVWSPYFDFSSKMFDINKMTHGSSYIIEFMLYDKNKLSKLYEKYGSKENMIEESYRIINQYCYPGDQEIYGNLIEKNFPDSYEIINNVETYINGDTIMDEDIERIQMFVKEIVSRHPDAIACSYHTYWAPEWI